MLSISLQLTMTFHFHTRTFWCKCNFLRAHPDARPPHKRAVLVGEGYEYSLSRATAQRQIPFQLGQTDYGYMSRFTGFFRYRSLTESKSPLSSSPATRSSCSWASKYSSRSCVSCDLASNSTSCSSSTSRLLPTP